MGHMSKKPHMMFADITVAPIGAGHQARFAAQIWKIVPGIGAGEHRRRIAPLILTGTVDDAYCMPYFGLDWECKKPDVSGFLGWQIFFERRILQEKMYLRQC